MRLLKILMRYMQIRWFSPRTSSSLQRLQARKKIKLHKRLNTQIPFYRDHSIKKQDLPVITKAFYLQHFEKFNRLSMSLSQATEAALALESGRNKMPLVDTIFAGLSTGTSGRRGVFLTSESERNLWSSLTLARALPHPLWCKTKIALLLRANNPLYETLTRSKRITFAYFDLTVDFRQWLEQLIAYQPTVLVAPPAALLLLARKVKDTLKPSAIFSGADILDSDDRNEIEQAFGVKIREIYQATEGFLGVSCKQGTLHLNEDFIHIEREYLDEQRRYFIPLITDFHRSTQAMVRFRLNDVLLIKATPCECGSPLLSVERVDGRADEIFLIPTQEGHYHRLFRGELMRVLQPIVQGAGDFRLEQTRPREFMLSTANPWALQDIEKLHLTLSRLWQSQEIILHTHANLSLSLAEKRRRLVRTFPDPAGIV